MSTATAPLTVDQFRQLPEDETLRCELVNGEIVPMGMAGPRHERVKSNINQILVAYVLQNPIGRVLPESTFALKPTEGRMPDVSLVLAHRLKPEDIDRLLDGAPDLAVEVVSSESASALEHKVNLYLETGSRAVWVVYPDQRTIWTHHPSGASQHLKEGQYLEEPELLPGFRVPVTQLFEGI